MGIVVITGMVESVSLKKELHRRQRLSMGAESTYAYVASIEALKNAKVDQDFIDKNEVGIIYGNDSTSLPVVESIDKIREKKDTTLVGSGAIFKAMNSKVTMNFGMI